MITTTTWSTPHHRLRRSLSSRRSLLVAALSYIYKKSAFPLIRFALLDTFPRLGEGFYSYAVFMLVGRSIQQSQTDTNDQCIQSRPRGTLIADQRRACAARPKGKNEKLPGGSLLLTRQLKFFPATGPTCKPRLPGLFQQLSRRTQVLCYFLH